MMMPLDNCVESNINNNNNNHNNRKQPTTIQKETTTPDADEIPQHNQQQQLSNDTKLTAKELDHLCSVMLRAKKFDEEETKTIEGQLSKYTNVVKGWQYRWFVINPSRGILEYYTLEDRKKPRGCISLIGCQIIPSDEDSQTFTVNAACGEVYKLKAFDAKDRQIWVDNLRLATQMQEDKAAHQTINHHSSIISMNSHRDRENKHYHSEEKLPVATNSPLTSDLLQSSESLQNQLFVARENHDAITNLIENISNTDEDLLLLKATSMAAINSLEQCFTILESLNNK